MDVFKPMLAHVDSRLRTPLAQWLTRGAAFLFLARVVPYAFSAFRFYFLYSNNSSRYKIGASPGPQQSWALVTGASDGIGKGFAQELCSRGFNVIIHGRNEKKLLGVKKELESQWKDVQIKVFVMDAGNAQGWTEDDDKKVLDAVKGLNLTLLVSISWRENRLASTRPRNGGANGASDTGQQRRWRGQYRNRDRDPRISQT
jgi:hypothetical protein